MKIVHITTVHHPFDNRIFIKECKSIAEMGHSVVLVVPHRRDEKIQNVQIKALSKPKGRLARMVFTTIEAYKKALHEDADIYHFHDPELIPIAFLLKKRGKIIIYDVHEDYYSSIKQKSYLPGPLRRVLANIFSFFELKLTKQFIKVLAEKYYMNRFPDGVQILNYPKDELLKIVKTDFDINKLQVIYTGNITKDRGATKHAKIVKYFDDIHVYLIGYCVKELAEELYEIAGKDIGRLHIHGVNRFVPYEKIISYYALGNWTAGLALFPPSPHYMNKELTKFYEYMGAGIPIICSDFPAWSNLVVKTGTGINVNPDDESEIKAAIEYLYTNHEQARQMGLNGRAKVKSSYNWENEALKLHNLYFELKREIK